MTRRHTTDIDIGKRVADLRAGRGLSQAAMAVQVRAAGVNWSQGTLSKVEAGDRPVRLAEAQVLAHVLHTDLYTLVGVDQPATSPTDTRRRILHALDTLEAAQAQDDKAAAQLAAARAGRAEITGILTEIAWNLDAPPGGGDPDAPAGLASS